MQAVFVSVLKVLVTSLLSEKVLIKLFVRLAEYLAGRTTNTLDDEIVQDMKKALER